MMKRESLDTTAGSDSRPFTSEGHLVSRRAFIAASASLFATAFLNATTSAPAVPNSSGTESPMLIAPPGACDSHHHIYDPKFPPVRRGAGFQLRGRVEEYQLLKRRLGTSRDVVVTPLPYAGDNRVTLDAIRRLAPNARGVALLRPDVSDAELRRLTDGGSAAYVSAWGAARSEARMQSLILSR
jgi:hypothetical protein